MAYNHKSNSGTPPNPFTAFAIFVPYYFGFFPDFSSFFFALL